MKIFRFLKDSHEDHIIDAILLIKKKYLMSLSF